MTRKLSDPPRPDQLRLRQELRQQVSAGRVSDATLQAYLWTFRGRVAGVAAMQNEIGKSSVMNNLQADLVIDDAGELRYNFDFGKE